MLGVLENKQEPHPPPHPMAWMRDPTKGKGEAPPVAPIEVPLGEDPDVALAQWLQHEA